MTKSLNIPQALGPVATLMRPNMKDKPWFDLASQMEAARELLEEGELQEALVLALDVLWRELDQLRDTLEAVRESMPQAEAEPIINEWIWPKSKLQHLH